MKKKRRLDLLLLERDFFSERNRARSEIMAGRVMVDGIKFHKPGTLVDVQAHIRVLPGENPYVSRGGLKIAGAAEELGFVLEGKTVLDSGSSTGGFTDFALKQGALKVYSVDVGYGQLAWNLRNDHRVVVMERQNVRYLKREQLEEIPDIALLDLSFISLTRVLPALIDIGIPQFVALVKPQFEAGREQVGKKGVVRDPDIHKRVLEGLMDFARQSGLREKGITFSRLKGPQGNVEYFIYWMRNGDENSQTPYTGRIDPGKTVRDASDFFSGAKA